ncbi:DUF481 domain-containing protein [Aureitalea sp. L0-47]|uniref:DUF481 domain-containing protein n=1 Tax=Aureitalea sp. L0-47 TaxID=2816962 RepID=UPI0022387687|nr:DUF481 domain-containing protein [Aureitalea sp. L0-47]MCW5518259.1 DUF481 domain-containing protein [Aureitalea sp. L0-47]
MKKILCCLLLIPVFLFAQTKEKDSLKLRADLSVTGFLQSGNVDTWIFRAKSEVSFRSWGNTVFKTKNSYVYQAFDKEKADEDILSLNFLEFNPTRKIYPFVLGFFSTNFRREINYRYLLGAGASFKILNKKNYELKASTSLEYENTDFNLTTFNVPEYNGSESIETYRATFWLYGKYHLFKNKIVFSHESYVQPSLEQINNYRWRADISLEMPIWKYLNFKINYIHVLESIVVIDQSRVDRFLTFGLTIKNY